MMKNGLMRRAVISVMKQLPLLHRLRLKTVDESGKTALFQQRCLADRNNM